MFFSRLLQNLVLEKRFTAVVQSRPNSQCVHSTHCRLKEMTALLNKVSCCQPPKQVPFKSCDASQLIIVQYAYAT